MAQDEGQRKSAITYFDALYQGAMIKTYIDRFRGVPGRNGSADGTGTFKFS
jgi:hypothetical protein